MVVRTPPRRLVLRPGVHVVPRGDGFVQVGVDPPAVLVVPDDDAHQAVLHAVRDGAAVPGGALAQALVARLERAGLLLDAAAGHPTAATGAVSLVPHRIDTLPLHDLIVGDGFTVTAPPKADVVVLVADGPLPRGAADRYLASGQPHIALAGTGMPGTLRVGPFVVPGLTACLHCVDAHESHRDPRRTLVIDQLSRLPAGSPAEADRRLGFDLVVRDVAAYLRGEQPITWSASIDLHAGVAARHWARHPLCGCAWNLLDALG